MAIRSRRVVVLLGLVASVLLLRRVRNRRARTGSDGVAHEDAETATDHVKAATEHARLAAEKASGSGRGS